MDALVRSENTAKLDLFSSLMRETDDEEQRSSRGTSWSRKRVVFVERVRTTKLKELV